MKKLLCLLMALVMVFSTCACSSNAQAETAAPTKEAPAAVEEIPAEAAAAVETDATAIDPSSEEGQVTTILNAMQEMQKLAPDATKYRFAVTDLDHNGRMELLAALTAEDDYLTDVKVCEIKEDFSGLEEIAVPGEMPEIMLESADTFHDEAADVWYYIFADTVVGDNGSQSRISLISLKDGVISYEWLAAQTVDVNGIVSFVDSQGNNITEDDFRSAVVSRFPGMERTNTNFDWFEPEQVHTPVRLITSYYIFTGLIKPAVVPQTEEKKEEKKDDKPVVITKNPTSEYHMQGETCIFVAKADNYTDCKWNFVCNGTIYSAAEFTDATGCNVSGANDGALYVYNANTALNKWTVYCVFTNGKTTARTSTAGFSITKPDPKPQNKTVNGSFNYAGSDNFATAVYISAFHTMVYVSPAMCEIEGVPYDGCPCIVHYQGNTPTGGSKGSVFLVEIYGSQGLLPDIEDPWDCRECGAANDGGDFCIKCGASRYVIIDPVPTPVPDPDPTEEPAPAPTEEPVPVETEEPIPDPVDDEG